MQKITKKLLSLLLIVSLVTVNFITPMKVFAADEITVTIDVNGGNELENNVISGPVGRTLMEIIAAQDESWLLQFERVRKQRTFLAGVVDGITGYEFDPEHNTFYGDVTIKLIWGQSELYSDNIEIEAEQPIIGDVYEVSEGRGEYGVGIDVQDPTPRIGGEGLDFDVFDVPFESRMFMVRDCDDPIEDNACLVPYDGEIEAGQKYYLRFYISIGDSYYMTNDVMDVLTVNGKAPTLFEDVTTYENGDFQGAWVVVEMDPRDGQGNEPGVPNVIIEPGNVGFGTLYVGAEEDLTQEVTITNDSDVEVEVEIQIPFDDGPFNIHEEANVITLEPHEVRTVTLSVDHGAEQAAIVGEYTGEYVFDFNEVGVELGDSFAVQATVVVSDEEPGEPETVSVTFITDGGTPVPAAQEIEKGSSISKPETDPYKEGFEFDVWCSDETKTQPYTFGEPINENLILYARYNEVVDDPFEAHITVNPISVDFGTFTIGSESDLYETVKVINDSELDVEVTITSPTNEGPFYALEIEPFTLEAGEETNVSLIIDHGAQKAGVADTYNGQYVFSYHAVGEQDGDEVLVQATVVVEEPEVTPEMVSVTFNTDGGTPVPAAQEIEKGSSISKPETDPYKEGFEFDVWCSDETKTQPYTFGEPINENLILYARYNEVTQGGDDPVEIDVTIVPNVVDFGTLYIGATEDLAQEVTVRNNSDVAVEIEIEIPFDDGPFNLHEESNTFTLEAHGERTVSLSVDHGAEKAAVAGNYSGEFVFNYNEVGVELGDSVTVGVSVVVSDEEPPTPEMVSVTFNTDGGTPVPAAQEIEKGSSISKPETDPYKEGFEFDVWCSDETKTQPYTFGEPINENLILYARYNEVTQGGDDPVEVSITVNPMSVDFGTFTIGSESDLYETVKVTNDSEVDVEVTIASPTNEGPFYALEIEPFTLEAGEETNVSLIIDHGAQKASVAGTYSGQYVFSYHAVGEQDGDEVLVQATVVVEEEQEAPLEIIDNTDNQNYDPEGDNADDGLTIKVSGSLDDLVQILVDEVEVPEGAVSLTSGSTIATFSPDFLSTLEEGTHTVTFVYVDGDVEATFTIGAANNNPTNNETQQENNPSTYDNISTWVNILGVSVLLVISGVIVLKKKHH